MSVAALCEFSVVIPCRFQPILDETNRTALAVARTEAARNVEVIVIRAGGASSIVLRNEVG